MIVPIELVGKQRLLLLSIYILFTITGFSPKMKSKRSRTHSKRSPTQDSLNQVVDEKDSQQTMAKQVMLTSEIVEIRKRELLTLVDQITNSPEVRIDIA